jgi:hypothetical protein
MASADGQNVTPEQAEDALRKAQELAQAAREHEAAERAQEMEQAQELERDGPER